MSNEERKIHVSNSCARLCTELKQRLLLIQSLCNGGRAAFDGKETEALEILYFKVYKSQLGVVEESP